MVIIGRSMLVTNNEQVDKMKIWCRENSIIFDVLVDPAYAAWCSFKFIDEVDMMAFKLRWM